MRVVSLPTVFLYACCRTRPRHCCISSCASGRERTDGRESDSGGVSVTEDGRVLLWNQRLKLSPSSISSFEQCPLLFRRRYVERVREPVTPALAAGSECAPR